LVDESYTTIWDAVRVARLAPQLEVESGQITAGGQVNMAICSRKKIDAADKRSGIAVGKPILQQGLPPG